MNLRKETDKQGNEPTAPELKTSGNGPSSVISNPAAFLCGFCILCLVAAGLMIAENKWGLIAQTQLRFEDQRVKNIFEKGARLVKLSRSQEAIAVYRQAFGLRPELAALAHADIAAIYGLHAQWDEATREYQEALRIDPKCAAALVGMGSVSYFQGKYGEAVRYFSDVLEKDPGSLGAYFARGDSFFRLGRLEEAKKDYEKFLELDPKNKSAHEVHNKLGMVLIRQEKFDAGLNEFKQSLLMNPAYAPAKQNVAEAWEFMKTMNVKEKGIGTHG